MHRRTDRRRRDNRVRRVVHVGRDGRGQLVRRQRLTQTVRRQIGRVPVVVRLERQTIHTNNRIRRRMRHTTNKRHIRARSLRRPGAVSRVRIHREVDRARRRRQRTRHRRLVMHRRTDRRRQDRSSTRRIIRAGTRMDVRHRRRRQLVRRQRLTQTVRRQIGRVPVVVRLERQTIHTNNRIRRRMRHTTNKRHIRARSLRRPGAVSRVRIHREVDRARRRRQRTRHRRLVMHRRTDRRRQDRSTPAASFAPAPAWMSVTVDDDNLFGVNGSHRPSAGL